MSFPVKWVSPEVSLEGAELVLNRYSINALPVVDDARLLGLISRQIVEKGIFHGLKDHPVKAPARRRPTPRPAPPPPNARKRISSAARNS